MACFLRSSNFLSMPLRISWKKSFNTRLKSISILHTYRNLPITNTIPLASFSSAESNVMTLENLEKSLNQLDLDAKYKYNTDIRDLEEILKALEHWGTINYHHSLILVKCCGSFSIEIEPRKRMELLEKALSLIENSGVELNISHYNSLLTAYIDNEQEFSPTDILALLQKKKINPNKITYQKLLKAYCQKGDIAGASEILEKMKKLDLSLNEEIFNSLIFGHCQVNDKANAKAILSLMESKGIEPSSETYLSFLCGHAKAGEIDEIRRIFEECERKEIFFFDKDILQVVYVLATNNHLDYIDEVLTKARKHFGYKTAVRYCALKLLHKNLDSVAVKIFETTAAVSSDIEDESKRYGNYLVSFFTKYRSMKETVMLCEYLKAKGLISTPYATALRKVLELEDHEKAFEMFNAMKENRIPVRPHYFWPLLILASKEGNHSILKIIRKMREMTVLPCFYTVSRIVTRNYKFQADIIKDIETLVEAGLEESVLVRSLFKWFLECRRLEDIIKLGRPPREVRLPTSYAHFRLSPGITPSLCILLINRSTILVSVAASSFALPFQIDYLIKGIVDCSVENKNDQFVVDMSYLFLHDLHECYYTKAEEETDTEGSSSDSEPEEVDDLMPKCQTFVGSLLLKIMNTCNETFMSAVLQGMLNKKINVPSETLKVIEEKFSSAEVKELISKLSDKSLCMEWDEDILKKKRKRTSQESSSNGNIRKEIWKMIGLVKKNESAKAVAHCKTVGFEETGSKLNGNEKKLFKIFLMRLAETGDIEAVEEVFSYGIKCNIITKNNFYPLVYTMMVRLVVEFLEKEGSQVQKINFDRMTMRLGDLEKATDIFCQRALETKCQSSCHRLVRMLIQDQNVNLLQKVTDTMTEIQGEAFSMGMLISQFSDLEKLKEIKKLLDARGHTSPKPSLNHAYNWLFKKRSLVGLEALLSVTKNIYNANRMKLCHLLLKLYISEEEAQKAVDLWWVMDEENILPPPELMLQLATLLEEKNIPVPFFPAGGKKKFS